MPKLHPPLILCLARSHSSSSTTTDFAGSVAVKPTLRRLDLVEFGRLDRLGRVEGVVRLHLAGRQDAAGDDLARTPWHLAGRFPPVRSGRGCTA